MALLRPDVQKILEEAGIAAERPSPLSDDVNSKLINHGFSFDDDLSRLSDIADNSKSEALRLKATELSIKMKGLLKDQVAPPPSCTIIINDSSAVQKLVNGVNPILVPRQMFSKGGPPEDKDETVQ